MSDTGMPAGLFERVIKRLGIEKEIKLVQQHLGFFSALAGVFLILSVFAFIGLQEVLVDSSFGPYFSLLFTDSGMMLKNWHSYGYSLFESMPGIAATIVLFALGFLMLFFRLVISAFQKWKQIKKSV